jgi:hypothetical protein
MKWLDRNWYRYLWYRRLGSDAKAVLGVGVLILLALAGYFALNSLADHGPAASSGTYVQLRTTVQRRVRVREHGRIVIKHVPVVKRIYAKPVTVQETQTIHTPSGPRVLTRNVVRYRPVYRRKVINVRGKAVTVKQVVTDTRMLTDTQLRTVTNEHTVGQTVVQQVTNEHTVGQTVVQQVTNEHTATVNQTVNQTVTNERTTTLPAETVTVVRTAPADTVTVHDTVTVTTPAETNTVTVPGP